MEIFNWRSISVVPYYSHDLEKKQIIEKVIHDPLSGGVRGHCDLVDFIIMDVCRGAEWNVV